MAQFVVAIDGPGGVGKSSVAEGVAGQLGCAYLDTGAFYRAATVVALLRGADLDVEADVLMSMAVVEFGFESGTMTIGEIPVDDAIRSDVVTGLVSQVAAYPSIRLILVARQRRWVTEHQGRAVVEGRDIGSVVFPEAPLKIYLTALSEVRATRRAGETVGADLSDVQADLNRRDTVDSTRAASPLAAVDDAVVIDTSDLTRDEVVDEVMSLCAQRDIG